jgi:hypothetical protein
LKAFAVGAFATLAAGSSVLAADGRTDILHSPVPDAVFVEVQASGNPFERRPPVPPRAGETSGSDLASDDPAAGGVLQQKDGASKCGASGSILRAQLRKQEMANSLCANDYDAIDPYWLFNLYYIKGFNDFLEERGAFMDPTGACSLAAEPRHALGLFYEMIDYVLGRSDDMGDPRMEEMLKPFREDWVRAPLVWLELKVWEREGRLDATSVVSRGMCGDPEFKRFWDSALVYAQRVPGTTQ